MQQSHTRGYTDMKTVHINFHVSFPQNTLEKLFCPQLLNWQMKTLILPLIQRKIFIAVFTTLSPAHCNLLSCCLCSQNLNSEDEDGEKPKPSFLDLVRTPQIRKHTFILMYSW